jgi:hypothetical protein
MYRLHGAVNTPIPTQSGTGRSAIACSWTSNNLLLGSALDTTCSRAYQLVNEAAADVPHAAGYLDLDRRRSTTGACLVTYHGG